MESATGHLVRGSLLSRPSCFSCRGFHTHKLLTWWGISATDICWDSGMVVSRQSRRFLESVEDNFLFFFFLMFIPQIRDLKYTGIPGDIWLFHLENEASLYYRAERPVRLRITVYVLKTDVDILNNFLTVLLTYLYSDWSFDFLWLLL